MDYTTAQEARRRRMDASHRTPDKFYYNLYDKEDGKLILSRGFPTRELAESFAKNIREGAPNYGYDREPGVIDTVEEAIAWDVSGKQFTSFADALLYMWENFPGQSCISGVFQK